MHDLKFEDIRDQSLTVRWQEPMEVNGILRGYKVEWKKKDSIETPQSVDLQSLQTYYTIQGLIPVTNYTICVNARTNEGFGEVECADIKSGVSPGMSTNYLSFSF